MDKLKIKLNREKKKFYKTKTKYLEELEKKNSSHKNKSKFRNKKDI